MTIREQFLTEGNRVFEPLCRAQQGIKRQETRGTIVRCTPGLSEGPGPYPAQQGIPKNETKDTGVSASQRRPLPN